MPLPPGSEWPIGPPGSAITALVHADGVWKENSRGGGPKRRIVWDVADADSDAAIDFLIGQSTVVAGTVVSFPQPHQYPGNTNLVCTHAGGEPNGPILPDEDKVVASDRWLIPALYEIPSVDPYGLAYAPALDGDIVPWSRFRKRSGLEINSAKTTDLRYGTALTPIPETQSIPVSVATIDYEFGRHMIPAALFPDFDAVLQGLADTVNESAIFGSAPGTLLFGPYDAYDERDSAGNLVFNFDMLIKWRRVPHNYVLVDGTADTYEHIIDEDDDTVYIYQPADWSVLKTFGVA